MFDLPFLRKYQYIEDYFFTLYSLYADKYVAAYPVTYYATDLDNTIWDDDKINAGSYEKSGVGPWSGIKWKKIQMLPVFAVEQLQMQQETGEKGGMTFRDSGITQVVFPSSLYNMLPLEGDVVDLSFGYKTESPKMKMLFTVNNINLSHQSDYLQVHQLQLRMAPFDLNELEKQVSSDWMFYEHNRIILPLGNSEKLLQLQNDSVSLVTEINSKYDDRSGFYFYEKD